MRIVSSLYFNRLIILKYYNLMLILINNQILISFFKLNPQKTWDKFTTNDT